MSDKDKHSLYLLNKPNLNMYFVSKYLNQIIDDGLEYPLDISEKTSEELKLYIPKNLFLPGLNQKETTSVEKFISESIYWLRYLRPEISKLTPIIENFTLVDLYLVTSNLFERYPGRKLLSYFNDHDLYLKFGRVGNFFFPKKYYSKLVQLDGIMAMCLQSFGYFTVTNWSRPVKILYHHSEIPLTSENISILDLNTLLNLNPNLYMPILRLAIQVQSNWPLISDKETWIPFINMIDSNFQIFYKTYLEFKEKPFVNVSTNTILNLPDNFESLEQKYLTCLLCEQVRPLGDFSLCGHGTCMNCQALLKTAKCPFCSEHFVADNLNDEFVRILQSDLGNSTLSNKIKEVNNLKENRSFKFDWSNEDIIIF
jgi:hypothetical protein